MLLSKSGCGKVVKSPVVYGISAPGQSVSSKLTVAPKPVVQGSSDGRNVPCDDSQLNSQHGTAVVDEASCLQKVEERLYVRWSAMKEVAKRQSFGKVVLEQLPNNMSRSARLKLFG